MHNKKVKVNQTKCKNTKPKDDGTKRYTKPLAMGYTDDEIRELCHSKNHDCATVVEHPEWGKGKPILKSHAIPDDNGYVEWYDVQFKHGIEEKVMQKIWSLKHIMVTKKKNQNTKTGVINAMKDMMMGMEKGKKETLSKTKEMMTKRNDGS